ncbi:MAG TPA: hypothetical protein VMA35_15595 [Candidatus Sulfopaludibacter sp.]|nr:hypothetical protein [Candidatus Sulfopaludibacter sp.]
MSENPLRETDNLVSGDYPVLVQTDHFRCMAYRDLAGKWIDYFHRVELQGNIEPLIPAEC